MFFILPSLHGVQNAVNGPFPQLYHHNLAKYVRLMIGISLRSPMELQGRGNLNLGVSLPSPTLWPLYHTDSVGLTYFSGLCVLHMWDWEESLGAPV